MRFPEGELTGKVVDALAGETIRAPIISGQEHLQTAAKLREQGINVIFVANHFAAMDPRIDLKVARKIGPLDKLAIFVSKRQLDGNPKGAIMKNEARALGFEIYPVVQALQRDQVKHEGILAYEEAVKSGTTRNEELLGLYEAMQQGIEEAKTINKHKKVNNKQKFPNCGRFNKRYLVKATRKLRDGQGEMILILAEGHRSSDGQMLEAEEGVASLLYMGRANTIILPIAIEMGKITSNLGLKVAPFGITRSKVRIAAPMTWREIQERSEQLGLMPKDVIVLPIAKNLPERQQGYYSQFIEK